MKRPQKLPAMHATLDRVTCSLAQAVADRHPDFQQMIYCREGSTTQFLAPLRKMEKGEVRLWRTVRRKWKRNPAYDKATHVMLLVGPGFSSLEDQIEADRKA